MKMLNNNHPAKLVWESLPVTEVRSVFFEKLNSIQSSIQFSNNKAQIITVTSAHKGEGKTFTSMNLAAVYAMQGKRVLIIDADMHNPRLSKSFQQVNKPGFSSVLTGAMTYQEVVQTTGIENLFFLPVGPLPPAPTKLLNSEHFKDFMMCVREEYDLILFDTPPILLISDSRTIGAASDGVILVIKAAYTKKADIIRAIDLIEAKQDKFLGAIFNDKKLSKREMATYSYY
ncbi:CpsD/CapB family tyrosine-protein kinase [Listeria booriae]|uniref:non-specific protein-tyrosine kinase n=1 Tax=Listeria booriae TaxID=1552123 RepID=A0A7X1CAX2_9LIST|nr:CpsD/CapB family tyrosine-protein kinase [Listeria booriae]MBC1490848.1 CpsD/CapB family tyrosine-protein kinase [Listeria booriae]MBC1502773.1 CpsD/CapB family tyrosine-protein kinase [Listeria booriae]MBC1513162.1 CpsD/CapB family tyrosine-protein kinase [Listeria booriae]MBC1524001.1 CpsD/CapB family tyrosine-protein kinase [Listeria booriae]MBC1529573.1 CpsD/CapB family tyrosine-protein kinase [Listeria booriae]